MITASTAGTYYPRRPVATNADPPTVQELAAIQNAPTIRPEVAAFALLMEAKLRENDGKKPHWRTTGETTASLVAGLLAEAAELVETIWASRMLPGARVHLEAADVANYAMMVADREKDLKLPPGVIALRIEEVRRG
ncbi:MAG: hypothetical protein QME79_14175 [Bacillota bacterium]|nr:hypothetical protein [Bacillota bacterium]